MPTHVDEEKNSVNDANSEGEENESDLMLIVSRHFGLGIGTCHAQKECEDEVDLLDH